MCTEKQIIKDLTYLLWLSLPGFERSQAKEWINKLWAQVHGTPGQQQFGGGPGES